MHLHRPAPSRALPIRVLLLGALALALALALLVAGPAVGDAQAALCAAPGEYAAPVTFANAGSALPDYIALTELDTASLVAAGRLRADGGDLHFFRGPVNACQEIPHWIESGVNSARTKIWIRTPVDAGTGGITAVYGSGTALAGHDAASVFGAGLATLHTFTAGSGATLEDGANSFDLTLTGAAAWGAGFRPGVSAIGGFQAGGRVYRTDGGPAFGTGSFSTWTVMRTTDINALQGLIGNYVGDGSDGWVLKMQGGAGRTMLLSNDTGGYCQDPATGAIVANTWTMMGAVRESGVGKRLFQNGALVGTGCAGDARAVSNTGPFELGHSYNNTFALRGDVSISATYDRALSDSEMSALSAAVKPAVNPVAVYGAGVPVEGDAPETTLTATPAAYSSSDDPSFSFSGDDGAGSGVSGFECQLDGGAFAPCTSPKGYIDAAAGEHTFAVRAVDGFDNVDPTPATHTWMIDTSGPARPAIVAGPSGETTVTGARFEFVGEPGGSFECRLDGGAWTPCASPTSYQGLGLGTHTFDVRQTDAAGNVGQAATSFWTVVRQADTTPPPQQHASLIVATIGAARGGRVTVGCRVDVGRLSACRVVAYVRGKPIGFGERSFAAAAVGARGSVEIRLNPRGRRAVNRVGGIRVVFRATVNSKLPARVSGQVLPETTRSVPTDGMFAFDSAKLDRSGKRYLKRVAAGLARAKRVQCVGHTDAVGDAAYNERRGLDRAKAVCRALKAAAMRAKRVSTSAGETRPRASNESTRGRSLNRRVELVVKY